MGSLDVIYVCHVSGLDFDSKLLSKCIKFILFFNRLDQRTILNINTDICRFTQLICLRGNRFCFLQRDRNARMTLTMMRDERYQTSSFHMHKPIKLRFNTVCIKKGKVGLRHHDQMNYRKDLL